EYRINLFRQQRVKRGQIALKQGAKGGAMLPVESCHQCVTDKPKTQGVGSTFLIEKSLKRCAPITAVLVEDTVNNACTQGPVLARTSPCVIPPLDSLVHDVPGLPRHPICGIRATSRMEAVNSSICSQ